MRRLSFACRMRINLWHLFLVFLIFLTVQNRTYITSFLSSSHRCVNIAQIPAVDRERLDLFLDEILYKNRIIYVLCGSKPMGIASYCSLPIPGKEEKHNKIKREGWHTWCKYRHLFPSEKLILRSIGNEKSDSTIFILFLHKMHFKEEVKKNRIIFEKNLEKKIDLEELVSIFENDPDPFQKALKQDHLLKGILFGYGVQNSQAFVQRMKMESLEETSIGSEIFEMLATRQEFFSGHKKIHPLNLNKSCRPHEKFNEKIKKLSNNITTRKHIKTFRKNNSEIKILQDQVDHPAFCLPIFAADPNLPETEQLRKRYSDERSEIIKKYHSKNLFEVFIANL
jgi:hypothetical protein